MGHARNGLIMVMKKTTSNTHCQISKPISGMS